MKPTTLLILISLLILFLVDHESAFAEENRKKSPIFFPYENCVLCRIKDGAHAGTGILKQFSFIPVKFEKILRGNFKGNEEVNLFVKTSDKESMEKYCVPGQSQVIAFQGQMMSHQNKTMIVHEVYFPFQNRNVTDSETASLKKQLDDSIYPYRACLLCVIQSVRRNVNDGRIELKVIIKDPILDNSPPVNPKGNYSEALYCNFKKDQNLFLSFNKFVPQNVFPKKTFDKLKNSLCVWSFNPDDRNGNTIFIEDVSAPFPYQSFSTVDIKLLKERVERQNEKLDVLHTQIEASIKSDWTVDRIQQFCRPQTQCVTPPPMLKSLQGWPIFTGRLYEGEVHSIGKVFWTAAIKDGQPTGYCLNISQTGDKLWTVGRTSSLASFNQNEFLKYLLKITLQNSMLKYQMQNWQNNRPPESIQLYSLNQIDLLIKNELNELVGFEATLNNGSRMVGRTDKEAHVLSLQVGCNAEANAIWNRILAEKIQK